MGQAPQQGVGPYGDFFGVLPGTVHALCAGTLVIETQQSSDITYRVYDYDRVQPDGTKRQLHIDQSCDVVDYDQVPPKDGKVRAPEVDGVTELMDCPKFVVDRIRVDGAHTLEQQWPFLCVSVYEGRVGHDLRHHLSAQEGLPFLGALRCRDHRVRRQAVDDRVASA